VAEQLTGRLAHEERVSILGSPFLGPRSTVVDRRASRSGPGPHPVDLHIGLTFLVECGVDLVLLDDVQERLESSDLSAREGLLRNDPWQMGSPQVAVVKRISPSGATSQPQVLQPPAAICSSMEPSGRNR